MPEAIQPKTPFNSQPQGLNNGNKRNVSYSGTSDEKDKSESIQLQIPQISLPKGGGAIKGIDEKFQVNAANGTAGFSIPLPISPGRNGFQPALSLNYNSGGSNSSFGLSWSVDVPAIQRKSDRQLPRYRDALEEDIFMLSGTEDLVPYLREDGNNSWEDEWLSCKTIQAAYRGRLHTN